MMSYPDKGLYDADEFPADEYKSLVEDVKRYYTFFRVFTGFLLVMTTLGFLAAMTALFVLNVTTFQQIKAVYKEGDIAGTMLIIAGIVIQAGVASLLEFGAIKLFGLSSKVIKAVKRRDFTFSVGELTDKSYKDTGDGRVSASNWILFVDDIPCTDLSNDYPKARTGRKYYIIYAGKARFAMPLRYQSKYNINKGE